MKKITLARHRHPEGRVSTLCTTSYADSILLAHFRNGETQPHLGQLPDSFLPNVEAIANAHGYVFEIVDAEEKSSV